MERNGSPGWEEEPEEILSRTVKDASLYTAIRTPGALQPTHLFPPFSGELVLVTLPDVINPLDLINSEVLVGGRKDSLVVAKGQKYRMATYMDGPDNSIIPSLFLPDQDGQLTKVTAQIKAYLVAKEEGKEEEDRNNCVDIEALRSVHFETPKELQRRDFFTKTKTREVIVKAEKPMKRKKKNADNISSSLDNSHSNGEIQGPEKRKKNKHVPPDSKALDDSLQTEELTDHIVKKIKKEHPDPDTGSMTKANKKKKKKL